MRTAETVKMIAYVGLKNCSFVKIHKKVTRKTVDINYKMWYNLK